MASTCGECLTIDTKYGCGWCNNSNCVAQEFCRNVKDYIKQGTVCTDPKITGVCLPRLVLSKHFLKLSYCKRCTTLEIVILQTFTASNISMLGLYCNTSNIVMLQRLDSSLIAINTALILALAAKDLLLYSFDMTASLEEQTTN